MLQAAQIPSAKPPSYFRKVDGNLSADTDTRLVDLRHYAMIFHDGRRVYYL